MASFLAGQIVIVDWRDAIPKEPNKVRPAVVVEDHELFDESYPNATPSGAFGVRDPVKSRINSCARRQATIRPWQTANQHDL